MSRFAELDRLILCAIADGKSTFFAICEGEVLNLATPLARPDRWGRYNGERVVDRRLQSLRQRGAITYRGRQWRLKEAA